MNNRIYVISSVFAWASLGAAQSIVYDNTTTSSNNNFPLLPEWLNDSAEVGDEIWLGGTAREAVELRLIFTNRGVEPNTFDAQLRFRMLDANLEPGTIFYDTGIVSGWISNPGFTEHVFSIPHAVVPDRFVWTIQLYNRQGPKNELGPSYFNPPTVGFSDDFFWRSEAGQQWTPYSWGGMPVANFGARLTAVPEPSILAALSIGTIAFLRRRKRS